MFSIILQLIYRCISLGIVFLSALHQKFKSVFSRRLKTPYESDNWNLRDLYLAIQLSEEILPAMIVHKSNLLHNIGVIRSICEKYDKKLRLASKVPQRGIGKKQKNLFVDDWAKG
jgi:predicted DNA-binding protein YlxM (UPF0122 family)